MATLLKISHEQMAAISAGLAMDFHMRMVRHLGQNYPDHTEHQDEAALLARVRQWVQDAEAYSILMEADVERYLDLCICYDVLSRPTKAMPETIRAILEPQDALPKDKLAALEEELLFD